MRARTWVAGAAVLAAALLPAAASPVGAAFASTSGAGGTLVAETLDPPTDLAASRSCDASTPTVVATTSAVSTGQSIIVPRPSEVVAGDLLMLILTGSGASGPWSTDPWTWTGGYMGGGGMVLARIATGTDPATYTINGLIDGATTQAVLLVYRGADQTDPWTHVVLDPMSSPRTTFAGSPFTVWAPDTASVMVGVVIATSYTGAITPGADWTEVTSVTQPGGLPGSMLVVERPVVQNTPYSVSATVPSPLTGTVMTFAVRPGAGPGPVELTWTPTPDTYATGYEGYRSDDPTTVAFGGPQALSSYTDTTLGTAGATYVVRAVAGAWRSSWTQVEVPAC